MGRISQQQGTTPEYFLGDALGSVRQLTASNGDVTLAKSYDPYGVVTQTGGTSQSAYGYTGEAQDSYTNLVYLRARFYNPSMGRFTTRDPSGMEANLFLYATANPINHSDPTGYLSLDVLTGPSALLYCFDFHSISHGSWLGREGVTVQDAIKTCRFAYSKDAWKDMPFNFNTNLPKSGHDLFGWYLFEHGGSHLEFHANEPLAQELSKSILVHNKRREYYLTGDISGEYKFNVIEQGLCFSDWVHNSSAMSLPLACVLGSFRYQIKTIDNGQYIGFRIDNRTDLESGTHIAGRYPPEYNGSVEDMLRLGVINGNDLLAPIIKSGKVISILSRRTQLVTGSNSTLDGGGDMSQTYIWKEKLDPCAFFGMFLDYPSFVERLNIERWDNYQRHTNPVYE